MANSKDYYKVVYSSNEDLFEDRMNNLREDGYELFKVEIFEYEDGVSFYAVMKHRLA